MNKLPVVLPKHTKWNDRLAFDMALMLEGSGEDVESVMCEHSIEREELNEIVKDPVFLKKVSAYRDDIQLNGLTFRLKARTMAEELLGTGYLLIHNDDVSSAVKADLIKSVVRWAGLEPKEKGQTVSAGGVSIMINLGETSVPIPAQIVEIEEEKT